MPKLSVAIISYNEERNIARTLKALDGLADEIILVDSFSTDATVEIASKFGAIVFSEKWKGYIAQKNSALVKCSGEWILFLDSDEEITPALKEEIRCHTHSSSLSPAIINRRTVYLGQVLRHSWQPDRKLRLVRSDSSPKWVGLNVHESLQSDGKPLRLQGEILHHSYRDIRDHWQKTIFYAHSTAESYASLGRMASIANIICNPLSSFIKNYIFRCWFLDGIPGLIAGMSAFLYTFLKYIFLWELNRKQVQ